MKKILFVTHSSRMVGGGEYDFIKMLNYFSQFNHKYELHGIFPDGPEKSRYTNYFKKWALYREGYFPLGFESKSNYLRYFKYSLLQINQIRKFTKYSSYDLCVINVSVLLWVFLILSWKKYKIILFVRENIYPIWLSKFIYKFYSKRCCFVITNTKVKKNEIKSLSKHVNIECVYPGVQDCENDLKDNRIAAYIKDKFINNKTFNFINIGSILNLKNQKLIIDSLILLKNQHKIIPNIFFIGNFKITDLYYLEINNKIKENHLDNNCFFLGELKRFQVIQILKIVDAMIISSLSECMPLSFIESLKYNKPVISTKVGGIPEIITNMQNGILVEPTVDELSNAMFKLISDKILYKNIASLTYKTYFNNFNLNSEMKKIESIFDYVLNI